MRLGASLMRRLLALMGLAAVALGQSTGGFSLSGVVLDPSHRAIARAGVTLKPEAGGAARATETDRRGSFQFTGLAAGGYELEVRQKGFKPSLVTVQVGPRSPAPLTIELALAELRQQITVESSTTQVSADSAENLDVVKLDRSALDNLPALGQDVVGTVSRFLDAASVGADGVTVVVDGMPTSERGITASAIQEVRINQNPYSAEFGNRGRGRVEIITNPGVSAFHGTLNLLFRDYHLDARNAFAASRPEEQRRIFEGSLTGPVSRSKKSSFLISANHEQLDLHPVIFARTPGGEVRENFASPARETFVSGRFNRQAGEKHTLSFRYEFADESLRGDGVGGFILPAAAVDSTNREHHFYFQHRAVMTPRLVNELQFRGGRHDGLATSRTPAAKIVVLDAFTAGGAQADRRSTENHAQFHDVLSWSAGRHLVKAGISSPDISRRGSNDRTNFGGTFFFSSLEDYRLGRPFSFVQQQGEGYLAIWQRELALFLQDDFRIRNNLSVGLGLRWDWQNFLGDSDNLAPRLSFAYAPGKSRKTVLRAGAGVFYDRSGWRPPADTIRYDGRRLLQMVIADPGYPDAFAGTGAGAGLGATRPSSLARLARDIRSPYTTQYSLGVERQLRKSTVLAVSYIGSGGVALFRSRDVNAPLPPFVERPQPAFGVIRQFESSARQVSHAVECTLRGNVTRFFNGTAQYVFGRVWNDTGGIYAFPAYSYDLSGEWSRADSDERHRFNLAGTVKAARWFNLGVIFSANSGRPYSLTTGRDENRDSLPNDRPPGVKRNGLQGPEAATLDLRWSRDFVLDRVKKDKGPALTLALEAFNMLNRVNYAMFVGNQSSSFFGRPVAARPARRMQIACRFKF